MKITRTIAEALAIAVLQGDDSAAYALIDQLILERETGGSGRDFMPGKPDFTRTNYRSHEVYHWPEFVALCNRLGVRLGLPTTSLTITLPLEGAVHINHEYRAHIRKEPS